MTKTTTPNRRRSASGRAADPAKRRAAPKREAAPKRSASVDPRLVERRIEVKRSEGRRRLRTLVALSVITLGAIGALTVLQSSWLDIETVVVTGAERTSPQEIQSATGIVIGEPLVELDEAAALNGVNALPWIASSEIVREWNGTITVSVTERTPAVALPIGSSDSVAHMLVDASGRQLEVVDERPYGFMPISGLVASGEPGAPAPTEVHGVVRLLGLLTPERQQQIERIVVADRMLQLELVGQGRVNLGSDSGLAEKLVSLDTILATVDLRCLWEIDVRVHTAPAVSRLRADGVPRAPLTDLSTCT